MSTGTAMGVVPFRRLAAVDVGSNAIRLQTLSVSGAGAELEQHYQRYPISLGRDVFRDGCISRKTERQLVAVFRDVAHQIAEYAPDGYRAVATAALREADNADQAIQKIHRATGLRLEVIGGLQEARLTRAALLEPVATRPKAVVLFDLGGGSLELSCAGSGADVSLAVGTLRLVEDEPALLGRVDAAQLDGITQSVTDWMRQRLRGALRGAQTLVGTGGNLDALARLIPCPGAILPSIDTSRLPWLCRGAASLSVAERAHRYGIRKDRAELILANIVILRSLVSVLGAQTLVVPGTGVRRSLLNQQLVSPGIEAPATLMFREQGLAIRPAKRLAGLAGSLFDGLRPLHGLWQPARDTLQAAAWLRAASSRPLPQLRQLLLAGQGLLTDPHARRVASCALARSMGHRAPLGSGVGESDRMATRRLAAILELAALLDDRGTRKLAGIGLLRRPVTIHAGPSRPLPPKRLESMGRALGCRIVVC